MLSFKDSKLFLLLTSFISFNLPTISESIDISLSIANAPIYARGIVTPTIANQILIFKILLILSFKDLRLSLLLTSFILFNCSTTLFNIVIFFEISISLEDISASILKYIEDTIKSLRPSFKFSIFFVSIDSIELITVKDSFITFTYSLAFLLDSIAVFRRLNISDNEYNDINIIVDLIPSESALFILIFDENPSMIRNCSLIDADGPFLVSHPDIKSPISFTF